MLHWPARPQLDHWLSNSKPSSETGCCHENGRVERQKGDGASSYLSPREGPMRGRERQKTRGTVGEIQAGIWYGVRGIPCAGVVSSSEQIPIGEVWTDAGK